MAISEIVVVTAVKETGPASSVSTTAVDTTGANGAYVWATHFGDDNSYTWSDNKGNDSKFELVRTINHSANDISLTVWFVPGMTGGSGHVFTVNFGLACDSRIIGGVALAATNGFAAAGGFSAATFAEAQGDSGVGLDIDAGSLVTVDPAYLFQVIANHGGSVLSAAGSGWAIKNNAGGGGSQGRNEGAGGTFDPVATCGVPFAWLTIAHAAKEGSPANPYPDVVTSCYPLS